MFTGWRVVHVGDYKCLLAGECMLTDVIKCLLTGECMVHVGDYKCLLVGHVGDYWLVSGACWWA